VNVYLFPTVSDMVICSAVLHDLHSAAD